MNTFRIHAAAAAIALAFSAGAFAQSPTACRTPGRQRPLQREPYRGAGRNTPPRAPRCKALSAGDQKACLTDAREARSRSRADAKAELQIRDVDQSRRIALVAKKETPVEYVEDSVITTKVKAAVLNDPSLKSTEINVETYKGVVQLSGFVSSRTDINRAVEVARGVRGVTSVKNVMIVKGQQ